MAIEYIRLKFDNQGQLTKAATNETALEAVLIDNFNIEDRRIMLQKELNKSTTDNRIKMSLFASNTDGKYTLFYNGLCCLYEKLRNNTRGSSAVSGMVETFDQVWKTPPSSEYYTFNSPNELHCKSLTLFKLDFTKQPASFTIDSQKINTVVFQNTDLSWYSAPISLTNQYLKSGVPNKEEFGTLIDIKTLYNPNVISADIGYLNTSTSRYLMCITVSLDTNDPKNNILKFSSTFTRNSEITGVNTAIGRNNGSTNLLTKNNTREGALLLTPTQPPTVNPQYFGFMKIIIEDTLLEAKAQVSLTQLTQGIYKKYTNINVIDYQDLQASDLNDKTRIFSTICSTSNVGYMKTESKGEIYNQVGESINPSASGSKIVTPVPSDSYIYLVEASPSYDTPTGDSNGFGDSDTLMVIKVSSSDFNKFGWTSEDNTSIYGYFGFFQDLFKNKGVNISSGNVYIDYKNNKYGTGGHNRESYFIIPSGYSNPFITNGLIYKTTISTSHSSIPDDLYNEYGSFMTIPFKDLP